MIDWLKANRLKSVSVLAVMGDSLMAAAGASEFNSNAGGFLMFAGIWALLGHLCLFVWGRGARLKTVQTSMTKKALPILLKPFMPWRYPLDAAFAIWVIGGVFYMIGGFHMQNMPLVGVGGLVVAAAGLGWLWPQEKTLFRFRSVQVTAMLYSLSSFAGIWAAIVGANLFLFLASIAYLVCNAILYTVRKENQSTYTQTHES